MSSRPYRRLRGRIIERFDTQEAFAEAFGISKNAFSKKMMGGSGFSQNDIRKCCELLEIDRDEIGKYFFE